jgi:dihydrofolate reductase
MTMKVSAYYAASLDGYIARPDGSIDWLNEANAIVPDGEDCGFQAFMDRVDTMVMGRKTFEQVLTFGQWPYGKTPVVVMSSNPLSIPATVPDVVTHSSETPQALCDRLSSAGIEQLYVDGGATIRGFIAAGLLDEITVTTVPVVLGGGISPFGALEKDLKLVQLRAEVFEFGFVQTVYMVQKDA